VVFSRRPRRRGSWPEAFGVLVPRSWPCPFGRLRALGAAVFTSRSGHPYLGLTWRFGALLLMGPNRKALGFNLLVGGPQSEFPTSRPLAWGSWPLGPDFLALPSWSRFRAPDFALLPCIALPLWEAWPYPVFSSLVLSCAVFPRRAFPCLALSCLVLSCLVLSCRVLPCLVSSCLYLS
jgi:hypothetical protein